MSAAITARTPRAYEWVEAIPFVVAHLGVVGAFLLPWSWPAFFWGLAWFWLRMFAITGGYHRYFSHRTYKTSRVFQAILAFLAETSSQKGVLWWAAHHRHHHRMSDQPGDVHSPRIDGFWYSHVGWLFNGTAKTDLSKVRDLAKFPELVWLDRNYHIPPVLLGIVSYLVLGWQGFFVGFLVSTVVTWHATFCINSMTHLWGRQRFETGEDSKNSLLLALVTLGEGWHNNHHYAAGSTRQGFYPWEIDITYYILRGLQRVGIVWDIREPAAEVLELGRARDAARRPRTQRAAPVLVPLRQNLH